MSAPPDNGPPPPGAPRRAFNWGTLDNEQPRKRTLTQTGADRADSHPAVKRLASEPPPAENTSAQATSSRALPTSESAQDATASPSEAPQASPARQPPHPPTSLAAMGSDARGAVETPLGQESTLSVSGDSNEIVARAVGPQDVADWRSLLPEVDPTSFPTTYLSNFNLLLWSTEATMDVQELLEELHESLKTSLKHMYELHQSVGQAMEKVCGVPLFTLPRIVQEDKLEAIVLELGPTSDRHATRQIMARIFTALYDTFNEQLNATSRPIADLCHFVASLLRDTKPRMEPYGKGGEQTAKVLRHLEQLSDFATVFGDVHRLRGAIMTGLWTARLKVDDFIEAQDVGMELALSLKRAEYAADSNPDLGMEDDAYRIKLSTELIEAALDKNDKNMFVAGNPYLAAFHTAGAVMMYRLTAKLFDVHLRMMKLAGELYNHTKAQYPRPNIQPSILGRGSRVLRCEGIRLKATSSAQPRPPPTANRQQIRAADVLRGERAAEREKTLRPFGPADTTQ